MLKITSKVLCIPPYLSTTWKSIASLVARPEGNSFRLIVLLQTKSQVEVTGLSQEEINTIFEAHSKYSESEGSFFTSLPLRQDGTLELSSSSMQHNPEQANLPLIPPDVLKKIAIIAKAFGFEDTSLLPKAEPNCNCVHCQVVRSFHEDVSEDLVLDEELSFKSWDIEEKGEKLYLVKNPLDLNEEYSVFLGDPIGCTCGRKDCEHIQAVLKS